MVMMGIREAYLIDCCFIDDAKKLQRKINDIYHKLSLSSSSSSSSFIKYSAYRITIIVINVDIIIIRDDVLQQKIHNLNTSTSTSTTSSSSSSTINDWYHHHHPII